MARRAREDCVKKMTTKKEYETETPSLAATIDLVRLEIMQSIRHDYPIYKWSMKESTRMSSLAHWHGLKHLQEEHSQNIKALGSSACQTFQAPKLSKLHTSFTLNYIIDRQ